MDVIEETVRAIKLDLLGPAKHPCGWKAIRMCSAPARQYKASRQKLSQSSRRMKKRSHAQNSCATSALRSERGCP